jgi:MFS family permease
VIPAEFRGLDRRIFAVAAARSINTAGFSIVMPYLALYLNTGLGARMVEVGAVYALASVCAAGGTFVGGELSDRIGRKPVMVSSLLVRSLVFVALGFAVRARVGLLGLAPLIVVNALLRSFFDPAAQAQVSMLAASGRAPDEAERMRTAAFGLQRIGINVGWALGPALGGFLAQESYGRLFFLAAPALLLAAGVVALVEDVPARAPRDAGMRLSDLWDVPRPRTWIAFLSVVLVMSVLTTQLYGTMSVYAMARLGVPQRDFGLLYTVNGVMVVVLQGLGVRLIQRFGVRAALIAGPMVYATGYALIGTATGFRSLAAAVAVVTLGELLTEPSEMVAAAKLGAPERQGRAMGVFGLVNAFGNALGPTVGGALFDHTPGHPRALWWTIAALGLVGAIGYGRLDLDRRAVAAPAPRR